MTLSTPSPSLVGRERELSLLRDRLAAAIGGRGSLVLIGGEAGIGKTALAEALCREAEAAGALVLVGRCYDLTETPPYGPWVELFGHSRLADGGSPLPEAFAVRGSVGSVTNQAALFREIIGFLAALTARQPVVLLLDDLHWADPASLDLLRLLARSLTGTPLLVLVTYRSDELTRRHPLYPLLPTLVREAAAARLDLPPLDIAATRDLVTERYGLSEEQTGRLVAYLHVRAEGNALFLDELLRTLEEERVIERSDAGWRLHSLAGVGVPPLLRQVIDGRLARLGDEARRLLEWAAIIGQEVPFAVWLSVAGAREALLDVIERAVEVRLLDAAPDGASVRFVHALIREALYEGILPMRRQMQHRAVGEAIVAASDPDPDVVAYHFQRAGDGRAIEWLVRAGLRARGSWASITACARFVAAAQLLAGEGGHASERGWLLLLGAQQLTFADTDEALRLLAAADALARSAGDPVLAAHIRGARGMVLCHRPRDVRAGVAELECAIAAIEALPPEDRRWPGGQIALARVSALLPAGAQAPPAPARTLTMALYQRGSLANWYGWTGRYREAWALGEATAAAALEDDPGRLDIPGSYGLGHAYGALGRPADARRAYGRWRAHLYAQNAQYVVEYVIWAELQHAVLPYQADDLPERARLEAEADRAWATVQDTVIAAPYPSQAALPAALLEGRWAEARQLAEAGVAFATIGHAQGAGAALGALARWQGDPEAAWVRVRALHPEGPDTAPGGCFFLPGSALQLLAAELALDAGDLPLARAWLEAHGRWLDWSGAVLSRAEHLLLLARHARLSGDPAAAHTHAEAALTRATEPRQPLALLAAHRLLGELDTDAGRHGGAGLHLDTALALAAACAAPYERALTLLALAALRGATDGRAAAMALLDEVRAICIPLDAAPTLARADALAARLASMSPPAPVYPDGLSAREVDVLRLIAGGGTNQEIAATLSLSVRTVERHITGLYRKIDGRGRADATAYALRHALVPDRPPVPLSPPPQ